MSNWTHVAGIIRIDAFNTNIDFDELVGVEWHYGDMIGPGPRYMPDGSEGSLCKSVWENPDISSLARFTVSIFGDLRDHDDPQAIIDWFKKICNSLEDCWVRQAVITVRNERNGTIDWRYSWDEE